MAQNFLQVNVRGTEGIVAVLKSLADKTGQADKKAKSAMRSALRTASNEVKKIAVLEAHIIDDPSTPERIADNIAVVAGGARRDAKEKGIVLRAGVRGGAKKYSGTKENVRKRRVGKTYTTLGDPSNKGGDTWYWRLVEFGVPSRGIGARPFLGKALKQGAGPFLAKFLQVAPARVLSQIKKAQKEAAK